MSTSGELRAVDPEAVTLDNEHTKDTVKAAPHVVAALMDSDRARDTTKTPRKSMAPSFDRLVDVVFDLTVDVKRMIRLLYIVELTQLVMMIVVIYVLLKRG